MTLVNCGNSKTENEDFFHQQQLKSHENVIPCYTITDFNSWQSD